MKRLFLAIIILVLGVGVYLINKNNNVGSENANTIENSDFGEEMQVNSVQDVVSTEPKFSTVIDIDYLRNLRIDSPALTIEETLAPGSNYKRFIASYSSEGFKVYGLLTVPNDDPPAGGYPAIVFNHGYIPPNTYVTTEKYIAYVETLARNGFVVFKIDMRGHGNSEGRPTGSYFSNAYTIDAISALKSLQKLDYVNAERIGMWGHSMAGNLLLRAMLVEEDIKAGVIWAGAVYSYEDFGKYGLNDTSYVRRERPEEEEETPESITRSEIRKELESFRDDPSSVDFTNEFWSGFSLTSNLNYLNSPIQLHHSLDDNVVNIGYARDLAKALEDNNKEYEIYEYAGGGHNINSPYFETAIQRTVEFFKKNL